MEVADLITAARDVIRRHLPGSSWQILVFGSQATGKAYDTSDVDLAIFGPQAVSRETLSRIREEINALPTLRPIDLVDLNDVDESFQKKVLKEGKIIE